MLSRRQTEQDGKALWNPKQSDCDLTSRWTTRIASEPHLPREARVGTLRAGQNHVHGDCRRGGRWRQADFQALVSHELDTGAPVCSAVPIAPEQRDGTGAKRMEQDADLARLRGRAAIPLTLLTQRTRAAVADASRIHHAQAAVGFSTPLLGMKRLSCGTTERSVGLERKVLTRKAPRFPGGGRGRRAIPRCGSGGGGSLLARLRDGGSKRETVRTGVGST